MSQSNIDERDVNREFLGKEYNSRKTDSGKVLLIYLSLNVDIPKHIESSKKAEHTKICNAIVEGFFDKISKSSFPPGKFETPYDFALDFKDVVVNNYVNVKLSLLWSRGFESNGLVCRYENDVLSINGTPNNPKGCDGIVQFVLDGCFYDVKELRERRGFAVKSFFKDIKIKQKFVLNPDPDSLWEDNPTPENALFPKPNETFYNALTSTGPVLTVLGASQRGRSHAQIGSFRDDHFLIRLGENPDDWNFVAVADGAGSARFSREGSKISCETCIDDPGGGLKKLFQEHRETLESDINSLIGRLSSSSDVDLSRNLSKTNFPQLFYHSFLCAVNKIESTRKNFEKESLGNVKISDFNTTFLCAAFKRLSKTEQTPARWIVLSYWVGDGGLVIYRPNGKDDVLALGTPDGGEFAGQTRFLTMTSEWKEDAFYKRLRLAVVEDFQALVLATDGITDPFFPAEANLSDYSYWQKFWNETLPKEFPGVLDAAKSPEERGRALLAGLKFKSKGNHDDRTLALVLNDAFSESQEASKETSDVKDNIVPDDSIEEEQVGEACRTIDVGGEDEPATTDEKVESSLNGAEESDSCVQASTTENLSFEGETTDVEKTGNVVPCDIIEDFDERSDVNTLEKRSSEEITVDALKNPLAIVETAETQDETNTVENRALEEEQTDPQKTGNVASCGIMEDCGLKSGVNTLEKRSSEEEIATDVPIAFDPAFETKAEMNLSSEVQSAETCVAEESPKELPPPPAEILLAKPEN